MFKKNKKAPIYKEIDEESLKALKMYESVDGNYNDLGFAINYTRIPGGLIRIVINNAGKISLTDKGAEFCENPSKRAIADAIQDKYKIFGEILIFPQEPKQSIVKFSRFLPRIDEINCPPVKMAISSITDFLISPNEGALTTQHLKVPFKWF